MSGFTARMNVLGATHTEVEGNHYCKLFVCSIPSADEVQNVRGLSVQTISTSKEVFDTAHLQPTITECDLTLKQVPGPKGQIKFVCTSIKAVATDQGKKAS